jgi:hypothetical protein
MPGDRELLKEPKNVFLLPIVFVKASDREAKFRIQFSLSRDLLEYVIQIFHLPNFMIQAVSADRRDEAWGGFENLI